MTAHLDIRHRRAVSRAHQTRGFLLLMGVLSASMVLLLSAGVFSIALKESALSSSARDSQIAFYAADSGVECALRWDLHEAQSAFDPTASATAISCANASFSVGGGGYDAGGKARYTLPQNDFQGGGVMCAEVEVEKSLTPPFTVIVSRGFNTCDAGSPRRVERALRVEY